MTTREHVFVTAFYDADGDLVGNYPGILSIPLFKGMEITIHGQPGRYQVDNWDFHLGHPDENAGLRVHLKSQ